MALVCELGQHKGSTKAPDFVRLRASYGHLDISFRRTLRVADNKDAQFLPRDFGPYPLYATENYGRLPASMRQKRGLFFPIHDLEAMSFHLKPSRRGSCFAVRVLIGNINALTGKPVDENSPEATEFIVVGDTQWVDGFSVGPDLVRQFVAVPSGSKETFANQTTGTDSCDGIQIQIATLNELDIEDSKSLNLIVKTLTNATYNVVIRRNMRISQVKEEISKATGISLSSLALVYSGKQLVYWRTAASYEFSDGSKIYALCQLRGGTHKIVTQGPSINMSRGNLWRLNRIMSIAPGGLLRTNLEVSDFVDEWNWGGKVCFNVMFLDSQKFRHVTGLEPPPPPMSAQAYSKLSLPYFDDPRQLVRELENERQANKLLKSVDTMRDLNEPSHPVEPVMLEANPARELGPYDLLVAQAEKMEIGDDPVVDWVSNGSESTDPSSSSKSSVGSENQFLGGFTKAKKLFRH